MLQGRDNMTKAKKSKTAPISKDLTDFLEENVALEIIFKNPKNQDEIISVKNVSVLVHMNSEIIIVNPDTIRIIPWELLCEVTYKFNEKFFKFALMGSRAIEKGIEAAEKRGEKVDDGRGFQ